MSSWGLNDSPGNLDYGTLAIYGCIIAVLGLSISTAVQWYRLSHIRGPFLASITSLWGYHYMRSREFLPVVLDAQRKYGKIVRISPSSVMVGDAEAIWHINSTRSTYARSPWYSSIRFNPFGDSIFSELDTAKHDKRKAKLAVAFSGKRLADLENCVDLQLAELAKSLKSKVNASQERRAIVDIGRILQYFQVDLISLAMLGKAWGDLPMDKDHFQYLAIGDELFPGVHSASMVPLMRRIFFSDIFIRCFGPSRTEGWLNEFRETVERRSKEGKYKEKEVDMLDTWLKQGISPAEAELDLALQVPAGTETSITTIRGILLYLMTTPRVYQKIKEEIADGIKDGRISSPIKNQEARALPYLQATINEGIRMCPPLTAGFAKVVPPGGDVICGKAVPAGTDVHVNMPAVMRDTEIFGEDAEVFRPERFIDCDSDTRAKRLKVVDLNFGHGRWLCLGKVLAWMEMNKIFVELLRSFDFQVANPQKPWNRKTTVTWFIHDFKALVTETSIG
jgi:cytochrome P450